MGDNQRKCRLGGDQANSRNTKHGTCTCMTETESSRPNRKRTREELCNWTTCFYLEKMAEFPSFICIKCSKTLPAPPSLFVLIVQSSSKSTNWQSCLLETQLLNIFQIQVSWLKINKMFLLLPKPGQNPGCMNITKNGYLSKQTATEYRMSDKRVSILSKLDVLRTNINGNKNFLSEISLM